jgi:hypothetical protein
LVDNDPGGVSEIIDESSRVGEKSQRARNGWGNFKAGRSAIAGGKLEPDEGFQPGNARLVYRGGSEPDVIPEGE